MRMIFKKYLNWIKTWITTSFLLLWFRKHKLKTLLAIGLVICIYICLEANIYCQNHSILFNFKWKILSNSFVLAIGGLFIWCYIVFQTFIKKQPFNKDTDKNNISEEKVKEMVENFYDQCHIDIVKQYFINDILEEYIVKTFSNNPDCNGGDDDNGGGGTDNNELSSKETDETIKTQMQQAKLNTYNNSYLTFCLLIDRCKTIEFKEDNKYDANQQPYCFQEIAEEAFELDWKGRRYVPYIAYSLLGTIGRLLEEHNKKEDNEKIPCVNASVVTKWERDCGNKWFCNGGIKDPNWCCCPPYKSKEGEDDRNFILELCKIVKGNEGKITSWKNEYYELLTEEFETKNEKIKQEENKFKFAKQEALNEVYKNYKEKKTKMSYQELEKQAQENKSSKPNRDNNK